MKRKKTKKAGGQDCEHSVMIEDQWMEYSGMSVNVGIPMKAEKLSNTELKIDFESLREYWFDKFAWSWPAIIGFYFLVASNSEGLHTQVLHNYFHSLLD